MAQTLLRLQQPTLALSHAQRASHWLQAVLPLEISPAEVQLTLARCLLACLEPGQHSEQASDAARSGCEWVQHVALTQMDLTYRDGWLQRNPINRKLLALGARLVKAAA